MKPTQSMYATRGDWAQAMDTWTKEDPSIDNQKQFMFFKGKATPENFMFEGDLLQFADCYFAANEWSEVIAFAEKYNYLVYVEETQEFIETGLLLDAYDVEHDDTDQEEYYDAAGNVSPGGLYDAGGHMHAERWAEYADDLNDQRKYRY